MSILRRKRPLMSQIDPETEAAVFASIVHRCGNWRSLHGRWPVTHYIINIAAVGLTLSATMIPLRYDQPTLVLGLSAAATLFVFFLAFAAPSKQSRSYIAAWRFLDARITEYRRRFQPVSATTSANFSDGVI
jgi:hypothetical protein